VIVLVALNLRAFLTSSSPLLEPIRLATGIGFHAVALLTVLPMFAMGATSLCGAVSRSGSGPLPSLVRAAMWRAARLHCCGARRSRARVSGWCRR
jgi:cyanate permease